MQHYILRVNSVFAVQVFWMRRGHAFRSQCKHLSRSTASLSEFGFRAALCVCLRSPCILCLSKSAPQVFKNLHKAEASNPATGRNAKDGPHDARPSHRWLPILKADRRSNTSIFRSTSLICYARALRRARRGRLVNRSGKREKRNTIPTYSDSNKRRNIRTCPPRAAFAAETLRSSVEIAIYVREKDSRIENQRIRAALLAVLDILCLITRMLFRHMQPWPLVIPTHGPLDTKSHRRRVHAVNCL